MQGPKSNGHGRPTLARSFHRGMLAAAMVPMLVAVLVLSGYDLYTRRARFIEGLSTSVELSAQQMTQFIDVHLAVITALAKLDSPFNAGIDRRLDLLRESVPTFSTMMAIDRSGAVIAGTPRVREDGTPYDWTVARVADRDYFTTAIRTGRPSVSSVFMGRGYGSGAIVAVSAPVYAASGDIAGVFQGSILAESFALDRARILQQTDLALLVLDAENGVVFASPSLGVEPASTFADHGTLSAVDRAQAANNRALTLVEHGAGADAYVAVARMDNGWRVVTFAPRAALYANLSRRLLLATLIAIVSFVAITLFARGFARRTTGPLRNIAEHMRTFAFSDELEPLAKSDAFREVEQVQQGYNVLVERLRTAYEVKEHALEEQQQLAEKLHQIVDDREREIARRTQELNVALSALREQSMTCGLTGLPNYRSMRMKCDEMHTRARARSRTMVAIAIDIDHFKLFNDTYGHPAGDRCLRAVSDALRAIAVSVGGVVGRVGGEEFMALAEHVEWDEAIALADAMRVAVEALEIPHRASPHQVVTISVGVARQQPSDLDADVEVLLSHADQALYRAKREGRNRVCSL